MNIYYIKKKIMRYEKTHDAKKTTTTTAILNDGA